MTQFAQRIVVDYHLDPLSEEETGQCIRHRLKVAGGHPSLFTNKACVLVHRLTRGVPRLINQVCDIALTYGFTEQARVITSKLVAQAAYDRIKGGILPLAAQEELSVLASAPEDAGEIDTVPPRPNSLAETLESVGQMAEAATLYSRIAHTNPLFKDAARRAKEPSPMPKRPIPGKRETMRNGSWFGNVINSLSHLMGSRK